MLEKKFWFYFLHTKTSSAIVILQFNRVSFNMEGNCQLKKILILIVAIAGINCPAFTQLGSEGDDHSLTMLQTQTDYQPDIWDYNCSMLYLGGFNYVSFGIGYIWGDYDWASGSGNNIGFMLECKTDKEMLGRLFWYYIGNGPFGLIVGISPLFVTDFEECSVGIAPEIGVCIIGSLGITYRYNYYFDSGYNCHQIGLTIYSFRHRM